MVLGSMAIGTAARWKFLHGTSGMPPSAVGARPGLLAAGLLSLFLAYPGLLEFLLHPLHRRRAHGLSFGLASIGAVLLAAALRPWTASFQMLIAAAFPILFLALLFASRRWGPLSLPAHVCAAIALTAAAPLLFLEGLRSSDGPTASGTWNLATANALALWIAVYLVEMGGVLVVHDRLRRDRAKGSPPKGSFLPSHLAACLSAGIAFLAVAFLRPEILPFAVGLGAGLLVTSAMTAYAARRRDWPLKRIGQWILLETLLLVVFLAAF
jgi:hypothetical protein